jgi:DNA-binding XRE family transcriptional regulator
MRELYLPYEVKVDEETGTLCLIGEDSKGAPFGVGSGATLEESEQELRDYVLEVLEFHASEAEDRLDDLLTQRPERRALAFGPRELIPIRLRLLRARAGLRQSDMAARLGIAQQAYAKLERPGANPTLRTLQQAEQALGTSLLEWR